MRRERVELEQQIKRQEEDHQRVLERKRREMTNYGAELQKQQDSNYERQSRGQFHMNEDERGYHRQYLESTGITKKDIIGTFPRESPSRRDVERFNI